MLRRRHSHLDQVREYRRRPFSRHGADRVKLYMADNKKFSGVVPSEWNGLLQELVLDLTGNKITGFGSHSFCRQNDWMGQTVAPFSCDAILCPKERTTRSGNERRRPWSANRAPRRAFWDPRSEVRTRETRDSCDIAAVLFMRRRTVTLGRRMMGGEFRASTARILESYAMLPVKLSGSTWRRAC